MVPITVAMRLSRRISRQRSVRYATAAIFIGAGGLSAIAALILGDRAGQILWVGALAVVTGAIICLVPTDRMHERCFHLLPVIVVVEISLASMAIAPNGAAVIGLFAFAGPAIAFIIETPRAIAAHIAFATAVLLAPLVLVETNVVTVTATLCMIPVTWGLGLLVALVWTHAEDQSDLLERLARQDPLTGAGNRRLLEERLDVELSRHRLTGRELALIVMDLNGFKRVNDELGHGAGDRLLEQVAVALRAVVREQDTIARQGGDEFCVLAPGAGRADADELVGRIRAALAQIDAGGAPLRTAVGYAIFPHDALVVDDLMRIADDRQREDKPADARGVLAA